MTKGVETEDLGKTGISGREPSLAGDVTQELTMGQADWSQMKGKEETKHLSISEGVTGVSSLLWQLYSLKESGVKTTGALGPWA